jgi:hypothetical protein
MKKTILFLLLATLLLFASCGFPTQIELEVDPEQSPNEVIQSSNIAPTSTTRLQLQTTTQSETVFFTTGEAGLPIEATPTSAKIAALTKEDGTGEIPFGTPANDVMATLDAKGILYSVEFSEWGGAAVTFEDGTWYSINEEKGLVRIYSAQTYRGLKLGDPKAKMEELYADFCLIKSAEQEFDDVWYCFFDNEIEFSIRIDKNGTVDYICIEDISGREYGAGA